MVFRQFFEVSEFWVQFYCTKLPNSNSVDNFASLDTPGGPEGIIIVELFVFEKYFSCFWMAAPPGDFFFLQIEAWCHLYYLKWLKSDIITLHSHNSIIFKEVYSLKSWFWNISMKIRSVWFGSNEWPTSLEYSNS